MSSIWGVLADYEALDPSQQEKTSKNLALLWEHFRTTFSDLGGFLTETPEEQSLYLEKLMAASQRLKCALGSDVAFHYVTVELMRQYIGCLRSGRSDRAASSLAVCAAALIDRGRLMTKAITIPAGAS